MNQQADPNAYILLESPLNGDAIVLAFPFGFEGTGPVLSSSSGTIYGYSSRLVYDCGLVRIGSGDSAPAAAVPEPSALAMAGIGGLMVAGCRRRRQARSNDAR